MTILMDCTVFRIRVYGIKELALSYNPGLLPDSAVRRLRSWIIQKQGLKEELTAAGWKKGNRTLTPLQVEIIVRHLGEP